MFNQIYRLIIISIIIFLNACTNEKNEDLSKFMEDANNSLSTKVEALPQVQIFKPMEYNVNRDLNNPFKPRNNVIVNTNAQPNLKRAKEPLEAYALDTLKFVGTISKNNISFALIRSPENFIYQVKVGNHLGSNLGMITAINENKETMQHEITIKETIQDELSGEWTSRVTKLALQENE